MAIDISTNNSYSGLFKVITKEQHLDPADILDDLEESHDQVAVDLSGLSDAKMRAAATFGFGQIHGLGMQAWHRSEISGKMLGNPLASKTVSTYMLSLRCRKTQKGDTPTSACAVKSGLLEDLYHFNNKPEFQEPQAYQPSSHNASKGQLIPCGRTILTLGYNLAFCGLLRIDELLKIQLQDITITKDPITGRTKLSLRLPFRKTSQFGGGSQDKEYQHICVVHAFAWWILISDLTEGYVFCKIQANDYLAKENEPMNSSLKCFATTFLISMLILFPMELMCFDAVGVNGCW
ncbi:hypothetical protein EV359DRAFT_87839 [Lentinula novae-zelandiae]|nr:hypothetical protein EV359DRAFT_87839 [Lentinula novae-zelandiae]